MRASRRVRRAVLLRFALVATALAAISAAATAWSVRRAIVEIRWIIHTREVLMAIERTHWLVKRAEASRRGYLLTGEPRQLELLREAVATLDDQIHRLAVLTRGNARRQDHIARLKRLVTARVSAMRTAIERHDAASRAAAVALLRADRQRGLDDPIRAVLAAVQEEEQRLLARHAEAAEAPSWVMILLAAAAATACFLPGGFAYRLIARELGRRQELESLAMIDPLTGLANRRALDEAMRATAARADRHGWRWSVILLEVDHL